MAYIIVWIVCAIGEAMIGSGCSQTVDFTQPYHLTSQERLTVAIDPALLSRVEQSSMLAGTEQGTYHLGPALLLAFVDDQSARARIDYGSSRLDVVPSVSIFLSGMSVAEYKLLVNLVRGSAPVLIEASGRGVSYWNSFNASQEAIELAVLDLATKVRRLLAGK